MERLADLVEALVQAGWRPIAVVNVIGTCGVILAVLKLPLDPDPTVRNLVPLIFLIGFLFACMTLIVVTASNREG